jgi:hypothetical protein
MFKDWRQDKIIANSHASMPGDYIPPFTTPSTQTTKGGIPVCLKMQKKKNKKKMKTGKHFFMLLYCNNKGKVMHYRKNKITLHLNKK